MPPCIVSSEGNRNHDSFAASVGRTHLNPAQGASAELVEARVIASAFAIPADRGVLIHFDYLARADAALYNAGSVAATIA